MSFQFLPDLVLEKILEKLRYSDRYSLVAAISPSDNLVGQYQLLTTRNTPRFPKQDVICTICFERVFDQFLLEQFNIGPFFTYRENFSGIDDVRFGLISHDEYFDRAVEQWEVQYDIAKTLSAFAPRIEKVSSQPANPPKKVRFDFKPDFDHEKFFGVYRIFPFEKPPAFQNTKCRLKKNAIKAYNDFIAKGLTMRKLAKNFKDTPIFRDAPTLLEHLQTDHKDNLTDRSRSFRLQHVLQALINEKTCISGYAYLRRDRVTPGKVFDFNNVGMTFWGVRDNIETDTYMILMQDSFLHGVKKYSAPLEIQRLLTIRNYVRTYTQVMSHYFLKQKNRKDFELKGDNTHFGLYNTLRAMLEPLNRRHPY